MMGRWVQFTTTPFLVDRTEPFLMQSSSMGQLARFAHAEAVTLRHLDISSARSVVEVIEGMKAVLTFPEWCGSSWDSIDDAFEEIKAGWTFPLVLVIGGPRLLGPRPPPAPADCHEARRTEPGLLSCGRSICGCLCRRFMRRATGGVDGNGLRQHGRDPKSGVEVVIKRHEHEIAALCRCRQCWHRS